MQLRNASGYTHTTRTHFLFTIICCSVYSTGITVALANFPFYSLYSLSNVQRRWHGIHATYTRRILWTHLYIWILWSVSSTNGHSFLLNFSVAFILIWFGSVRFTYAMFTFIIGRCFFRGSGGTVNVLRISGTQGYPECGTQRVSIFQNRHSLARFTHV